MENILQALRDVPAAWVGLLGVIFGSLLTTLGVWLTNQSNAKNIKVQLEYDEKLYRQRVTKERLEELYILVCHWQHAMFSNFINLTLVMEGHTDYNQYLDSISASKPKDGIDFNRLEMILDVYGTKVHDAHDEAIKIREKINVIINDHKAAYRRGEPGHRFLPQFRQAQLEFENACDLLKAAIAESARNA